ncbi:MAG TPA: ester cyclase [Chloroflexia bacterium]|nr:ester cyclase [Chloroflexia bacterium]
MVVEQNISTARRFIEEILGKGNFELFRDITTDSYLDHSLPSGVTPLQSIGGFRAGFPDLKATVEDIVADGDKCVVRWTVRGTNTGSFFGMPPTGKQAKMSGISMYRFKEGKLAEGWVEYDQLNLMQQLGAIPS